MPLTDIHDPFCEHSGFAGTGSSQYQHIFIWSGYSIKLLRIKPCQYFHMHLQWAMVTLKRHFLNLSSYLLTIFRWLILLTLNLETDHFFISVVGNVPDIRFHL